MAGEHRILVTGASGFIGSALVPTLNAAGCATRRAVRRLPEQHPRDGETAAVGDVDGATDWAGALRGIETVVHLVARTHVLRETASDPLAACRRVNVDGTRRLATQAAAAGVRARESGTPQKLLKLPTDAGQPSAADRNVFAVVLPLLPVTPNAQPRKRLRAARPSAHSASSVSGTSSAGTRAATGLSTSTPAAPRATAASTKS